MTLRRDVSPTLILIRRFLEVHGPAPLSEICKSIGIDRRWTHEYVKIMRANKEVRVAEWGKRKSGAPLMMYALGSQPDVPKPAPKRLRDTRAASYAKHRERMNQERRVARAKAKGEHPTTVHYMTILGMI